MVCHPSSDTLLCSVVLDYGSVLFAFDDMEQFMINLPNFYFCVNLVQVERANCMMFVFSSRTTYCILVPTSV